MTFEHYIITRFNLPIFQPKVNGNISTSCSEDYLQYRFKLFEEFCMPSIVNQTCQNFKWLVLFDIHTPHHFKLRVAHWHEMYSNLVPCYLNLDDYLDIPKDYIELCSEYEKKVDAIYYNKRYDMVTFEQERPLRLVTPLLIKDAIKRCSNKIPDFYITTRIDNDDAFHCDMIATIQDKFQKAPKCTVYDFVYSYKYVLNERVVYRYPLKNGHFISLVEPSDKLFQSVIYWNHLYIELFVNDVQHFYQEPLQVELIHGNNVVNDFTKITCKGLLYGIFHFKRKDFGYEKVGLSLYRFLRILFSVFKRDYLRW